MPPPRLNREQIEKAASLRERGWSLERLGQKFGCSASAMSWHMLKEAADPKDRRAVVLPQTAHGPLITKRGNHLVRRFTPEEDALIQRLSIEGMNNCAIGRTLNPKRRPNSIRGRLMTLARHEVRNENAASRDLV